jgi:hypothetical protein
MRSPPDKRSGPDRSPGHRQPTPSTTSSVTNGKDRWHQLAEAIQDSNLPASDKSVFRYLLDRADYKTGELPAKFTPTRKTIRRKTSLSYSQVGYSTAHLQRHGWLIITGKPGPGHPRQYEFRIGADCHCTGRVHVADVVTDVTSQLSNPSHTKIGPDLHGWHRVTDVTDLQGNRQPDIADPAERHQPAALTVPTDDPRTLPTNGANAAGQTTRPTERHREGGGRMKTRSLETTETACPRHQAMWRAPIRGCLFCQALNIHLWP